MALQTGDLIVINGKIDLGPYGTVEVDERGIVVDIGDDEISILLEGPQGPLAP
jgi:hypothetical protein